MAPRRKKGGNKGNEMERFRVGDLVLAKVKGFAAWPAKISRPEDWKRMPDPKKYFVRFFGTSEIGFVAPSNIKTFTISLKSELMGRPRIKQSKDFARAVDEICQAFEELQPKSSEITEEELKLPEAPVKTEGTSGLLIEKEELKVKSAEASADTILKNEDVDYKSQTSVFSTEEIAKDPSTSPEAAREKTSLPPSPSTNFPVKYEARENIVEEGIIQIKRKKRVSASELKVQVGKRRNRGISGDKEVKASGRRVSMRVETRNVKDKDLISPKTMENRKTHLSPAVDLPVSQSKKSPIRSRRRVLQLDDDKLEEEMDSTPVRRSLEDNSVVAISSVVVADNISQISDKSPIKAEDNSVTQNPLHAEERKPEKTPEKYEDQRLSSSLEDNKSDRSTKNKARSMVKASTSASSKISDIVPKRSIVAVRQKPKPSLSMSEKNKEKVQAKDLISSKGFNLLQEQMNVSVTFKSKFVDSSTSMKDLIAVAQAKRKETHSHGVFHDNLVANPLPFSTVARERSRSPIFAVNYTQSESKEAFGSISSPDNNEPNTSLLNSLTSEKDEQINVSSDDNDAAVARDAFEAMVETLSRTKESIRRATHQAIECAKLNMAREVVDLLIRKLETEISFRRRIDLFFLVDSITQCSHNWKGVSGASYVSSVQSSLTRLLNAAAPPGAAACENRHQCLKVLKLWLERKIFPESVLRPIIDGIEVPGMDPSSGLYLRRQCRSERSIDDPIREMDGMLVDEYGSNVAFQLPGLLSIHDSEVEDDDLPHGSCDEISADRINTLDEQIDVPSTPIKSQHHFLGGVDGELEMEESGERKESSVETSPPLPSNVPPSPPPPPPLSPPPPPPPPPPQHLAFRPPLTPAQPPVPYPGSQHMPYSSSIPQNHFTTPNGHNPPFAMSGVNAGQHPQVNVRPCDYSHQEAHLPPHGYHPMHYQPAGQPMVHVPYPPAPVGQPPQGQLPPHHPNLTPQPPPVNFHYPRQNPYFLPPPNPALQHMNEGQWGSYPGWRPVPPSGAPPLHDGRFNSNLVAPVGSVPVPPAHGGPQIFPYRPDAPLNSWRPT